MALSNSDMLRYAKEAVRRSKLSEAEQAVMDRAADNEDHGIVELSGTAERVTSFQKRLKTLDQKLENIQNQLEAMGVPVGIAQFALIREIRVLEQARLLRCVNGALEPPLPSENYRNLYEWYLTSGLPDSYSPAQPAVKSETALSLHEQVIDGIRYRLYGDPIAEKARLIGHQGNTRYAMRGTCGLCSTGNVLTMAGAEQAGEEDIIDLAMHASNEVVETLGLFQKNTDHRGATTAQGRQELLQTAGLASRLLRVQADKEHTMRELARMVRAGYGVIISVDVARLWKQGKGGHAITLIAVTEDGSVFFYCDTGRGCIQSISAKELGTCLTGAPANVTENIIR